MSFTQLNDRPSFSTNQKVAKPAMNLKNLIAALEEKSIPEPLTDKFNQIIGGVNDFQGEDKALAKSLKTAYSTITKMLEKDLKIVPPGYYQTQWLVLGMLVFGLPFGVVFGTSLGNMGYLGIGLPIGMSIGIAVGNSMDTKAKAEGRQLDFKPIQ